MESNFFFSFLFSQTMPSASTRQGTTDAKTGPQAQRKEKGTLL